MNKKESELSLQILREGVNQAQKSLATMYALLNQISWACKNGIHATPSTT